MELRRHASHRVTELKPLFPSSVSVSVTILFLTLLIPMAVGSPGAGPLAWATPTFSVHDTLSGLNGSSFTLTLGFTANASVPDGLIEAGMATSGYVSFGAPAHAALTLGYQIAGICSGGCSSAGIPLTYSALGQTNETIPGMTYSVGPLDFQGVLVVTASVSGNLSVGGAGTGPAVHEVWTQSALDSITVTANQNASPGDLVHIDLSGLSYNVTVGVFLEELVVGYPVAHQQLLPNQTLARDPGSPSAARGTYTVVTAGGTQSNTSGGATDLGSAVVGWLFLTVFIVVGFFAGMWYARRGTVRAAKATPPPQVGGPRLPPPPPPPGSRP